MECYGRGLCIWALLVKVVGKMANQICIAGLVQALSEGLNFAMNVGLDTDKLLEAIGGAAHPQMVNRGETMVKGEFDFGFAVDWMRKDLRICLEEAKRNGVNCQLLKLLRAITPISAGGYG